MSMGSPKEGKNPHQRWMKVEERADQKYRILITSEYIEDLAMQFCIYHESYKVEQVHDKKLKETKTHYPKKRTLSPGENVPRSESKHNFVGTGPFCSPAI
jgi:hypothetical protein